MHRRYSFLIRLVANPIRATTTRLLAPRHSRLKNYRPTVAIAKMAGQAEAAAAPVAVGETAAAPTEPSTTEPSGTEPTAPPLSKNQQKKLAKQKRFEETRPAWKAALKEKEKTRKARKREENALKRKAEDEAAAAEEGVEVTKRAKVAAPKVVENITLLIDCGFDELMTEKASEGLICGEMGERGADEWGRKWCRCPPSSRAATPPTATPRGSSRCKFHRSTRGF